jgi:hypothetical protein
MKKIIYALCLLAAVPALAQEKYVPAIKQGTTLRYTAYVNGQSFACAFSFDSIATDFMKIGWNIDVLGSGSWVMKSKSLQSGTRRYSGQPSPGMQEELPDDQTVLLLSKAQWESLQKDKKVNYDQQFYTVKAPTPEQQLTVGGKQLDAILLESPDASIHVWILNSAAFPILLKSEGNSVGADLIINAVE